MPRQIRGEWGKDNQLRISAMIFKPSKFEHPEHPMLKLLYGFFRLKR